MSQLTPALLDRSFPGRNLVPGPLRAQLGDTPALVVLIRHFGCLFCQELITEVRNAARAPGFPRVVVVHQGPGGFAANALETIWPEVRAIEDPERAIYGALGIGSMKPWDLLRPRVWRQGLRALGKGFRQGRSGGASKLQMPGAALIVDGRTVWQHHFDGPGDLPDWNAVARIASDIRAA